MMIFTDGSCRRNGKPDCVAGFAAVTCKDNGELDAYSIGCETGSTSQRGELHAFDAALQLIVTSLKEDPQDDYYVVSDSAYIVNAIRNEWFNTWKRYNWITASGTPVKNVDLWIQIMEKLQQIPVDKLNVYLIKGHLKTYEEGAKKFAENNFGAQPPQQVFEKMMVGNTMADSLAKYSRDIGENFEDKETTRLCRFSLEN